MFPAKFEYHVANSVDEAVKLLSDHEEAKVLAGGHSLLPLMKLRLAQPSAIVDIGRIRSLRGIRMDGNTIRIGALTTHHEVESSDVLRSQASLLAETADVVGDLQVRNRGTIGGSLAHADPAGDLPAAVLALDAELVAVGPNGERTIPVTEFFVDYLTTSLAPNEILTEVRVPVQSTPRTGSAYLKMDHPASHYALCGVAAVVKLGDGDTIADCRVAITGIGAKAYRAESVEAALRGTSATQETLESAVATAADGQDVNGDIHASAEYRAHLARVYARRALEKALERARG
ncbi:MAG: xanthine dehydrogenase family protein subunit M [Chloroflexi bacterium]|nr:xanthine dehydrogenase family protein subunit M [Chloroflexota bacterium]